MSVEGGSDIRGMDRITRHLGLWSFGFLGVGMAFLTPSIPLSVFYSMPHGCGMGGSLRPASRGGLCYE